LGEKDCTDNPHDHTVFRFNNIGLCRIVRLDDGEIFLNGEHACRESFDVRPQLDDFRPQLDYAVFQFHGALQWRSLTISLTVAHFSAPARATEIKLLSHNVKIRG
jgi:hypothetical protein